MISASLIKVIIEESMASPQITRVPEPRLTMDARKYVEVFDKAGTGDGPITPVYLFVASQVAQVIVGCEKVLDLACGSGRLLTQHALANPKIKFTGVDLSAEMLGLAGEHLREQNIHNVDLRTQDITNLSDFDDHSFDAVTSSMALHHLPNEKSLETCFKEIRRVLKPNGRIFLFDYCQPKRPQTIDYIINRTASGQPAELNEDNLHSLKAAFPFSLFKQLAHEKFPEDIQTFSTGFVSFMTIVKSPSRSLSTDQEKHFWSMYQKLNSQNMQIYKDIIQLFRFGGLKSPIR